MKDRCTQIYKWRSLFLLFVLMIGGGIVITHDASYELSDDTFVQLGVGVGNLQPINEKPVFSPSEGRFFPLAYQHFNILLLCYSEGANATVVYLFQALLWCVFLIGIYKLILLSVSGRGASSWSYVVAVVITLAIAQRTLSYFSVLWTTISIDYLLLVLFSIAYYYALHDGKWWDHVILFIVGAYFTFCIETNIVVPLMVCACSILNLNKSHRTAHKPLYIEMAIIVLLYILLYVILIFPHLSSHYDPAHGENTTFIRNAVSILMSQKLLILSIGVFIYRLYKVFVKKCEYDGFSDTLLATSMALLIASFILKLNYPLYYVLPIILSIPALVKELNIDTKKSRIVSIIFLGLIGVYFIEKIPGQVISILEAKTKVREEMIPFDNACKSSSTIVWFMDNKECRGVEDVWAQSHVQSHMAYLKLSPPLIYPQDKDKLPKVYLLITPISHTLEDVISGLNISKSDVVDSSCAPDVVYYHIHLEP